tara:strand:+ start:2302 stop:2565 length:264 start_codon:yes stop_codon:yes gene_type:complete
MSKINESIISNLAALFTGAAIGKAVSNKKPRVASKSQIDKILKKNPELKKASDEMKASQQKILKSLEKALEKMSPEQREKIQRIYGI